MECAVIAFVVFVVLLGIFIGGTGQMSSLNDAYRRLATRYGGWIVPGNFFKYPQAHFPFEGRVVSVIAGREAAGSRWGKYSTKVTIPWPHEQVWLQILPASFWTPLQRWVGLHGALTGQDEFDQRYLISAHPSSAAARLLSGGVRQQVERLRRMMGNDQIEVEIGSGWVTVYKAVLIRDYSDLARFVAAALALYDQLQLTQSAGIEFLDEPAARPEGEPECQICGEGISGEMVLCRRCKTPHHRDCWHYNGACSIYGCRETRYTVPKPPRSPAPETHDWPQG